MLRRFIIYCIISVVFSSGSFAMEGGSEEQDSPSRLTVRKRTSSYNSSDELSFFEQDRKKPYTQEYSSTGYGFSDCCFISGCWYCRGRPGGKFGLESYLHHDKCLCCSTTEFFTEDIPNFFTGGWRQLPVIRGCNRIHETKKRFDSYLETGEGDIRKINSERKKAVENILDDVIDYAPEKISVPFLVVRNLQY